MDLGEKISQYRKALGISQEELGARLGVSRQAVSKWETNAAAPDMANLMALARELGVSVAELTETPEQPQAEKKSRENLRLFLFPILIVLLTLVLLFAVGTFLLTNLKPDTSSPAAPPPENPVSAEDSAPARTPATDFALIWANGDGHEEFLELGTQEGFFPFGTSLELTAPEEVLDTDYHATTVHRADCGALLVEYTHMEEDPAREAVVGISTISSRVRTPRGIHTGSTKADVTTAYGDELVYSLKEPDRYTLVPHDYYYIYHPETSYTLALYIYMRDGLVAGLKLNDLLDAGSDFDAPDNISRFPMKDGEPDFSLREEPEREPLSDTRRVYTAFNQLVTNDNLTAEERYAYRRDIFTLLPDMDWEELRGMGTAEYPDDTFFALLNWLEGQDDYTASEIFHIQWGCTAKGLDGAYTDAYCELLSYVLFYDPVRFSKNLALEGPTEEERIQILRHTAYDAEWHPVELKTALETLDDALNGGQLTEAEAGWTKLLRLYLTASVDERNDLPRSPSELS